MIVYKLNCIVAYTGAHYMVFMRVRVRDRCDRVWTLYNDTESRRFEGGYPEVANFLVTSNVVPTMVLYESNQYTDGQINQNNIYVQQEDDAWLMLLLHAQQLETEISGMMQDQDLVR